MTVPANLNRVDYTGTGSAGPFTVPFPFYDASHLTVLQTDALFNQTTLTGWTATGVGGPSGAVTLAAACPVGSTLTILRIVPLTQITSIKNQEAFFPEVHEQEMDLLAMADQQLDEAMDRTLRLPAGLSGVDMTLPKPDPGHALVWNAAGDGLENAGSASATLQQDLADSADVAKGDEMIAVKQPFTGAVSRTQHDKNQEWVSVLDFGADPTGVVDSKLHFDVAMSECVSKNKTLFIPDGNYLFNGWLALPSGLKMFCSPASRLTLGAVTTLGGFVCGGYDYSLNVVPFEDVELHNLTLDCASIAGENGFNAVSAENVRIYNMKVYNCIHSPVKLGGRAVQFEGGLINNVNIYNIHIENCSIGINSHAFSDGSHTATHTNYWNVTMKNVDVPFNVDSQFANPETNTLNTMSTFIHGAELQNCGALTFPGNSGPLGAGIVCGDRGYGLRIDNMRVVNEAAYGGIGALVRGVVFGVILNNIEIETTGMTALFDFGYCGFGAPSSASHPSTIHVNGVRCKSNLDYIISGGASNDKMGACSFRNILIDESTASIAGIVSPTAGTGTSGSLSFGEFGRFGDNSSTGFISLAEIYSKGNTINTTYYPVLKYGTWTPVDVSGASLTYTVTGTPTYQIQGRALIATCALTIPTTSDTNYLSVGGLPYPAVNDGGTGGAATVTNTDGDIRMGKMVPGQNYSLFLNNSLGVVTNASMSGKTVYLQFVYIMK